MSLHEMSIGFAFNGGVNFTVCKRASVNVSGNSYVTVKLKVPWRAKSVYLVIKLH